jgi:hypothetical protein
MSFGGPDPRAYAMRLEAEERKRGRFMTAAKDVAQLGAAGVSIAQGVQSLRQGAEEHQWKKEGREAWKDAVGDQTMRFRTGPGEDDFTEVPMASMEMSQVLQTAALGAKTDELYRGKGLLAGYEANKANGSLDLAGTLDRLFEILGLALGGGS